jgi:hypothetical protein
MSTTGFTLVSDLLNKPITNRKISIQGPINGGKSWLAGTIGTPEKKVRFFDFDGKAEGFRKHPNAANILVKSYVDKTSGQGRVPEPRAGVEFLQDINLLEYDKKNGKYEPCVNVIDSMKYLEMALNRMHMYAGAKKKASNAGGIQFNLVNGWDAYNDSFGTITDAILNSLFTLDDLIVIFHERPETDKTINPGDTEGVKNNKYTGRYSIDPPRLDGLKSLFVDKYRVLPRDSASGPYQVQLETDGEFLGATSLLGTNQVEVADLAMLLRKDAEYRAKQSTTTKLPTTN